VPEASEFPPAPPLPEIYAQRAAEYRTVTDAFQFPPGTADVEEKRRLYAYNGGRVHDAPNAIIIYSVKTMLNWPSGLMNIGILAQTICLAALAKGLGTCIMGRPVAWPNLVRELTGIPQSKAIIISIAIGYPDKEAKINNYPRTRLPLESLVKWYGF
jgi:nitroreductase